MILNLRLHNWRAFDNLDLELGPGTTFIVASNGIGKTSLMMAAAWSIFGDASGVDPTVERRGNADTADVEVALHLPASGVLEIKRWIDGTGHSHVEANVGGRVLSDQADINAILTDELGADLPTLARLTFMTHGGSLQSLSEGEFDLRDHLSRVFGVAPLLGAANAAARMGKDAAAAVRKVKAARKVEGSTRDALAAEISAFEPRIEEARAAKDAADTVLTRVQTRARIAEGWKAYEAAVQDRDERVAGLIQSLKGFQGAETVNGVERLAAVVLEKDEAVGSSDRHLATLKAKLSLEEEASKQLHRADAVCPTCLRPLSADEVEAAVSGHDQRIALGREEIAQEEVAIEERRLILRNLRATLTKIQSFPEPVRPGEEAEPALEKDPTLDMATLAAREAEESLAELRASHRMAAAKLEEIDNDERQNVQLLTLLRQESVALAAAAAFGEVADAITTDRIEPLVGEVGRRWKRVFGVDGLRLSPAGRITRTVGGRELPFSSLSGGEKVWAMLLTRLLVTSASTHAPFVWLDEPLEHLDPRLRRIVAGTLARASQSDALRQVVVTTYESELAMQLMEDVPSASLIYVRAAD
ncbi:MAG: AAA family ATPase [Actinomycetota bacterium]